MSLALARANVVPPDAINIMRAHARAYYILNITSDVPACVCVWGWMWARWRLYARDDMAISTHARNEVTHTKTRMHMGWPDEWSVRGEKMIIVLHVGWSGVKCEGFQ